MQKESPTEVLDRLRRSPAYAAIKGAERDEQLRKRRQILAELRAALPTAEAAAARAAREADAAWARASDATTKARLATEAAADAQTARLGLDQVVANLRGKAWGAARELDDPRIGALHRWVSGLHATVLGAFRVTGLRPTQRQTIFGPQRAAAETTNAGACTAAAAALREVLTEIDDLTYTDYGTELAATLHRLCNRALVAIEPVQQWIAVTPHTIED